MNQNEVKLHRPLFFSSMSVLLGLALIFSLYPEASSSIIKLIRGWIMSSLGSVFLIFGILVVVAVLFLSLSSVGKIKLGNKDDVPQFKLLTWLAMIFTGGCGSSMIYWGTIEWAFYFKGGLGNTLLAYSAVGKLPNRLQLMAYFTVGLLLGHYML